MQEVMPRGKLSRCFWQKNIIRLVSTHCCCGSTPLLRISLAAVKSHWKLPPSHTPTHHLSFFYYYLNLFFNSLTFGLSPTCTVQMKYSLETSGGGSCSGFVASKSPFVLVVTGLMSPQNHRLLQCTFYWNVKCWFVIIVDICFLFFFLILIYIFIVNLLSDRRTGCKIRTLFCDLQVFSEHNDRKMVCLKRGANKDNVLMARDHESNWSK